MRPPARRLAALTLASVACVAAVVRIAPLGPSLTIAVTLAAHNDVFDRYDVTVWVRGGEPISEIAIERVSGPVSIVEGAFVRDLPPRGRVVFQVRLDGGARNSGLVRVAQKGAVARTYDVAIGGDAP